MLPALTVGAMTTFAAAAGAAAGVDGAAGADDDAAPDAPLAPLLEGLGDLHYPISTSSEGAQRFFDQGLRLVYAFNHAEAVRAFEEAARLDPEAPMPHWGRALALGRNLNDGMPRERELQALDSLKQAQDRRDSASEREQALIDALASRYSTDEDADRAALDAAWVEAIAEVAGLFPDDPEPATLHAAAIMNTMPWDYWRGGEPQPGTLEAKELLERVIAAHPDHPGAHHYYIHLMEAREPQLAEPSADALGKLMPSAGHLVHMPAHIYIRVGRYDDAVSTRTSARSPPISTTSPSAAPRASIPSPTTRTTSTSCGRRRPSAAVPPWRSRAPTPWPKKSPWRWLRASPSCRTTWPHRCSPASASAAGRRSWTRRNRRPAKPSGTRCGATPKGLAAAATGDVKAARKHLKTLGKLRRNPELADIRISFASATDLVRLTEHLVAGEIHAAKGRPERAVAEMRSAAALQDSLRYAEPPPFHYPVRQSLGALLLEAGQASEAEAVYRQDLEHNPHNGWSLFGLAEALRAQNREEEADEARQRFVKAWQSADIEISASVFR